MNREVDLLSYLPPFLQEFKENRATLEAENPEFVLVWNGADRVLKNEFIETADEAGISRFESILNITPSGTDTLESRRRRVQIRWFNKIPYTLRAFLEKLAVICGDSDFTVTKGFLNYRIDITTHLEWTGQADELDRLIQEMMPCNMVVVSVNKVPCRPSGSIYTAGTICFVEQIGIADGGITTEVEVYKIDGSCHAAGALGHMEQIKIMDEIREEKGKKKWLFFQN